MPRHRTTHRSSSGKKLYAVRDEKGRFLDIQSYERAHRADLRKSSKAEITRAQVAATAEDAHRDLVALSAPRTLGG